MAQRPLTSLNLIIFLFQLELSKLTLQKFCSWVTCKPQKGIYHLTYAQHCVIKQQLQCMSFLVYVSYDTSIFKAMKLGPVAGENWRIESFIYSSQGTAVKHIGLGHCSSALCLNSVVSCEIGLRSFV